MAVTEITRDQGVNVSIVRMTTTNTLDEVAAADYVLDQMANITAIQGGTWTWLPSDVVLCYCTDGHGLFEFFNNDFNTMILWTSGGGGNITKWVDVTGTTQIMKPNTGYVADNVALVSFTLPEFCKFGDIIKVDGFGSGGWIIFVGTGQTIHLGLDVVTPSTGSIASTQQFDSITLRCVVPNAEFVVESGFTGGYAFT